MQTVSYEHYSLRRDVATIAKFVNRMASHREKLALWQMDSVKYLFPSPPSKSSKYPAYEAARSIELALGLETHASSVPELAALLGEALKVTL